MKMTFSMYFLVQVHKVNQMKMTFQDDGYNIIIHVCCTRIPNVQTDYTDVLVHRIQQYTDQ